MDILRDPAWQFVGALVAILTPLVSAVLWYMHKNRTPDAASQQEAIRKIQYTPSYHYAKHKKRRSDGLLPAHISSDFLNQFPVSAGVLAADMDRLYTPENFGADDWLTVFRRFTEEGYFKRHEWRGTIALETLLDPGPKLESWLQQTVEVRRSIAGLD